MTESGRDRLVYVGDVHIQPDDPVLPDFLSFLDRLGDRCRRVVLMGDLFDLWIGRRELEQAHHAAIAKRLAELRDRGVSVAYLEGNRDYRISDGYRGFAFDESSEAGIVDDFGGHRIFAVHGDLVNVADKQYRAWRRLSRSGPFWAAFNLLPRRARIRLAEGLEARMRGTNLAFKRRFPSETVERYASEVFRHGHDVLVLGHFHVEKEIALEDSGSAGRVFVLPEWKGSRRHLAARPDGGIEFVDSAY